MGKETFDIESTEGEGDARVVHMRVPLDSRFFEGHFEGMPMLPGVAQVVAIANRESRRLFGALGTPRRLSRLKFQDTILPGDHLVVSLTRDTGAEPVIRFKIERILETGPRVASSGTITYGSESR